MTAAPPLLHMYWVPLKSGAMVDASLCWFLSVAAQQPTWTAEAWQGQASAGTAAVGAHRPPMCWVAAAARTQRLPCSLMRHVVWRPWGSSPGGQASPARAQRWVGELAVALGRGMQTNCCLLSLQT